MANEQGGEADCHGNNMAIIALRSSDVIPVKQKPRRYRPAKSVTLTTNFKDALAN
jgi:hypothetical protein